MSPGQKAFEAWYKAADRDPPDWNGPHVQKSCWEAAAAAAVTHAAPTLGEVARNGYFNGRIPCMWENLTELERDKWTSAGEAVAKHLKETK